MKQKVFVTGGTGFVGSNLVRLLLAEGYEVKTLARENSSINNLVGLETEIVYGELCDTNLHQSMKGCSALFHVAAHYSLWQADREELYRSNVLGTRAILGAAERGGIERVVYTSSVAAIGTGGKDNIVNEKHQTPFEKLIGDYKKSKYLAEQEARKAIAKGQDIVIVNPTSPVGSWDQKPTPTGEIIVRFLRREMPFYIDTGLNLIDVKDVAWGHLLALQKGVKGKRYILGNKNMTLKEILNILASQTGIPSPSKRIPYWIPYTSAWIDEKILTRLGKKPSIALDGVKMASQMMYYDSTLAKNELGMPHSSVAEALQNAVTWFYENGYAKNKQQA